MNRIALLLALVIPSAARADQALISCEVQVAGRQISLVSRTLHWSAHAVGAGAVEVSLAVPIDSFSSGHDAFDALFRAAAQTRRSPAVELTGTASGGKFEGTLSLRGVSRPIELRLDIARVDGLRVIRTVFPVELAAFGVSLPDAGPAVTLEFVAVLPDEQGPVLGGGMITASE